MSATDDNEKRERRRAKRARRDEIEERVEFTLFLLKRRRYKSEVKRQLKEKYHLSPSACEIYIRRARELYLAETGKSKDELRSDALSFYESILAGPDATLRERMLAQERIDKLMGLEVQDKDDKSAVPQLPLFMPPVRTVASGENRKPDPPAGGES